MFIKKIILNDYRIFKGECEIEFTQDEVRNVYIISGNNGYGKTTFLTSLVWCFYGKNMIDVEKKYREDVYDSGGYKKYAKSCLNIASRLEGSTDYSVEIMLTDVFIPSVPCEKIQVIRSYNVKNDKEDIRILIDGAENELTKEVGNEIFINDFILPREVAKFFFFDAEKIVALAEIASIEEKQSLSKAYSEVLGIKKYEDLKDNLIDLRTRLRRATASNELAAKLDLLYKEVENQKQLVALHEGKIANLKEELISKRHYNEQLQEKLIREGNALTTEQVSNLKAELKSLSMDAEKLKGELEQFIDLAPFAIANNLLRRVSDQLKKEEESSHTLPATVKNKVMNQIQQKLSDSKINDATVKKVFLLVDSVLADYSSASKSHGLLDLEEHTKNFIISIVTKLKYSYTQSFREASRAYKDNRSAYAKAIRRLSDAETKENDLLIKELRNEKVKVEERIHEIYTEIGSVEAENDLLSREMANKQKQISEVEKKVNLHEVDFKKDEVASRLINDLQHFIRKLKNEKKQSLEENIKYELNRLMHKRSFVHRVVVILDNEMIDIILYRKSGEVIEKEKLSKGEQQLYATALLKALVSESNLKFPVFIDSPLQKFDKMHSEKVINEFYPSISEQVVLFPLLEKELSEKEFQTLSRKVAGTYLIQNFNSEYSFFEKVDPKNLFTSYTLHYDTIEQH